MSQLDETRKTVSFQHVESWKPLVYHRLDPLNLRRCQTCSDFRETETGLEHLFRTAKTPEIDKLE